LFNGECVYKWKDKYCGFWGGGGTGWWIDKLDSTSDFDIELILEKLELDLMPPDVPRPESKD
jgi:hypothetical protein